MASGVGFVLVYVSVCLPGWRLLLAGRPWSGLFFALAPSAGFVLVSTPEAGRGLLFADRL
ncbi:hypothetical protein ABZ837_00960 [Streptomyces sp. NPDC047197]|uniref:hypothetical protein n=1 Tax=Streptomyces sp. NPDC047197 TaxID=3155477 RepID=UPI0033FB4674